MLCQLSTAGRPIEDGAAIIALRAFGVNRPSENQGGGFGNILFLFG